VKPTRAPENPLQLSIRAIVGSQHLPFLRSNLRKAHRLLKSNIDELSIALVNDAMMAELHERYLGVAAPTDVLTFPLELARGGGVRSGEIIVCVPEAQRRVRDNVPVRNELLLYALHGLLHLMGHDDTLPDGFETMHRIEDQILTQLGVGPVFGAKPRRQRTPRSDSKRSNVRRVQRTVGRAR
jgi:probable rRNA maturation factor